MKIAARKMKINARFSFLFSSFFSFFKMSHCWNLLPQEDKEANVQLDAIIRQSCGGQMLYWLVLWLRKSLNCRKGILLLNIVLFPYTPSPRQPLLGTVPVDSPFVHRTFIAPGQCLTVYVSQYRPHRNCLSFGSGLHSLSSSMDSVTARPHFQCSFLPSWADPGHQPPRELRATFIFLYWEGCVSWQQAPPRSGKVQQKWIWVGRNKSKH